MKLNSEIYIDKDNQGIRKFESKTFNSAFSLCDSIRHNNDCDFAAIPYRDFLFEVEVDNLDKFDCFSLGK